MRLVIEISTMDPDGDTPEELWQAMLEDIEADPIHKLTLETRNFVADVRVVSEGS